MKKAKNYASKKGTGQKLWQKAKKLIPGGNQLLSKRAEMFLPELWPAYYKSERMRGVGPRRQSVC